MNEPTFLMCSMSTNLLYFHGYSADPVHIQVDVVGGSVVESWPNVVTTDGATRFPGVTFHESNAEEHCLVAPEVAQLCDTAPAADGICERAELWRYVSDDSSCLRQDDRGSPTPFPTKVPFLFYRAEIADPNVSMPWQIASGCVGPSELGPSEQRIDLPHRRDRATDVDRREQLRSLHPCAVRVALSDSNSTDSTPATERLRVTFDGRRWRFGVSQQADETVPLARDTVVEVARNSLNRSMTSLGLSAGERAAFTRAWEAELLGVAEIPPHSAEADESDQPWPPRAPSDSLLMWAPASWLNAHLRLTITPSPSAPPSRAILIRFDLTRLPVGCTAAPSQ